MEETLSREKETDRTGGCQIGHWYALRVLCTGAWKADTGGVMAEYVS